MDPVAAIALEGTERTAADIEAAGARAVSVLGRSRPGHLTTRGPEGERT